MLWVGMRILKRYHLETYEIIDERRKRVVRGGIKTKEYQKSFSWAVLYSKRTQTEGDRYNVMATLKPNINEVPIHNR